MRTICCRFRDRRELLDHLRSSDGVHPDRITFLATFAARHDEELTVRVELDEGPGCEFRARVSNLHSLLHPVARQHGLRAVEVTVPPEELIWLKAFLRRTNTWGHLRDDIQRARAA